MNFDLTTIRMMIRRFWWMIPLILGGALAGTWAWLQRQQPVFSSRAVIEVAQNEQRVVKMDSVKTDNPAGLDYVNTAVEAVLGSNVMLKAAEAVGIKQAMVQQGLNETGIVGVMRSKVSSRWRKNTRLIDVVATDTDPVMAKDLAMAVVKAYLRETQERRTRVSADASDFLVQEAERQREKLAESQKKVSDYLASNNQALSLEEQQKKVTTRMGELGKDFNETSSQLLQLEADLANVKKAPANDNAKLLELESISRQPAVLDTRTRLAAKEAEFSALKLRYKLKHPRYISLNSEVEELKNNLAQALKESVSALGSRVESLTEKKQKLDAATKEQEAELVKIEQAFQPYRLLQREVENNRTLYETVANRMKETKIVGSSELDKPPVTIVEDPLVPAMADWPNKTSILLRAGVFGLLGALGLIFLLDRMDTSIRGVDQVEQNFQIPVLASVPDENVDSEKVGHLPILEQPSSFQAEAYRTLRTSLTLLGDESVRRLFLVTSAIPAEGKTRTAVNLALSFAQQGLKTLIIDADLRRPSVGRLLYPEMDTARRKQGKSGENRRPNEGPGLSEHLSGLCSWEEIVRPTAVPGLNAMLVGRQSPNPAELLAQNGFQKLLTAASSQYDRIIVDSSPLNSVSDALSIVPLVHGVVVVIRACSTPRMSVKKALEQLKAARARITGVVLNRVPARVFGYYGYYKYDSKDPYIKEGGYEKGED